MKYYFISGEASGDLHAANCMRGILKIDPAAQFAFTGGEHMEEVSGQSAVVHIRQMAFMGFIDVLKNLGAIRRNFRIVKADILKFKPDILVLVDYPGFNLRMAEWAWKQGIKVDYYISPTVWAWKEGRVELIRKYVNKLFVILPFEEGFYKQKGLQVYYVGHPLFDAIEQKMALLKSREEFLRSNALTGKPIVAVLPGSRLQELERMVDLMLEVVPEFPDYEFVVAGSGTITREKYDELGKRGVKVVFEQTYELLKYARAGIIKSGTSTLESALFNLPQVVCYRAGSLSFAIGKRLVNVKFISLVNLILNKEVVKELIQTDLNPGNISHELSLLLEDSQRRKEVLQGYEELHKVLGGSGASTRLAKYITDDAKAIHHV
ncbi:MAG TPA: lipid-A-disaccharide synthase [Bacteroidia bacterium]|nr:lipid-A-disaccharide synthase [Bacteroidia bacterium]